MRRAALGFDPEGWAGRVAGGDGAIAALTSALYTLARCGRGEERWAAARRLHTRLMPRGAPLTAALWTKVQPGAAWPAHALHEATDARGQPRWVVDELRPRWAGRPWVLTLARAELWCADEDRRDDALAAV